MKKYFLQLAFTFASIASISQAKVATIDPGKTFSGHDRCIGYYDQYASRFRVTLQDGYSFTRLLYDSNFSITDSFSFQSRDITFVNSTASKYHFMTAVTLAGGAYEVYKKDDVVSVRQSDFKNRKDSVVFELKVGLTESDETLSAVFPAAGEIKMLTASFEKRKLFLYSWSPTANLSTTSFDLPESNVTDENLKKQIPREARVKFRDCLDHLSAQPVKQTSLVPSGRTALYYSDDLVYILCPSPYQLGFYVMRLDLRNNVLKGTNFFVNTLKDNASTNPNFHKYVSGMLFDTFFIIKNASDRVYEYYFYDMRTNELTKKYSYPSYELKDLIHSEMKQKGSWGSANEEKEIDHYKAFLRKGGTGMIYVSAISNDSLTITNLAIRQTPGVGGTLINMMVPMELSFAGVPDILTAFMPNLGPQRSKLIYAHSRFSLKDLALSKNSAVTTPLDDMLNEKNVNVLSGTGCFLIQKENDWYLGAYSKDTKQIEVYKYNGNQ